MTVTHVMHDIETWGTEPGCDIRSIGACVFDPVTGYVAHSDGTLGDDYFYLATDNPTGTWGRGRWRTKFTPMNHWKRKYPLTRDADTMRWWSEQSDEAQTAFTDPVDLREALGRFADWLDTATLGEGDALVPITKRTTVRLWSHGAHFDGPILAAAYRACNLPVPWHYRAPRDTRTAFDMAGIEDHSAWLNQHPGPLGIPHHALDDAICQARAVCGAYRKVQSPDREFHVGRIAMQQYADWTNQHTDIGGAWSKIERAIHEGAR